MKKGHSIELEDGDKEKFFCASRDTVIVSTYPKPEYNATSTTKFLYIVNFQGMLKCIDISSNAQNRFQDLSTLKTYNSSQAAMIFEDLFKEIHEKNAYLYAIFSFSSREITMYRLSPKDEQQTMQGSWEKFQEKFHPSIEIAL